MLIPHKHITTNDYFIGLRQPVWDFRINMVIWRKNGSKAQPCYKQIRTILNRAIKRFDYMLQKKKKTLSVACIERVFRWSCTTIFTDMSMFDTDSKPVVVLLKSPFPLKTLAKTCFCTTLKKVNIIMLFRSGSWLLRCPRTFSTVLCHLW